MPPCVTCAALTLGRETGREPWEVGRRPERGRKRHLWLTHTDTSRWGALAASRAGRRSHTTCSWQLKFRLNKGRKKGEKMQGGESTDTLRLKQATYVWKLIDCWKLWWREWNAAARTGCGTTPCRQRCWETWSTSEDISAWDCSNSSSVFLFLRHMFTLHSALLLLCPLHTHEDFHQHRAAQPHLQPDLNQLHVHSTACLHPLRCFYKVDFIWEVYESKSINGHNKSLRSGRWWNKRGCNTTGTIRQTFRWVYSKYKRLQSSCLYLCWSKPAVTPAGFLV